MSNVTVTIGGRHYTVACAAGEEQHIEMLGRTIDGKLGDLNLSGQSEARTLLFAALLLADELHEAQAVSAPQRADDDARTAEALESLAERLEDLAERLESAG
jgi:cell division protein ZapA